MIKAISEYQPFNAQEAKDQKILLEILKQEHIYSRKNEVIHMTASAWVVNPSRDKVLMVYHKIYDSWSWMGGHADGDKNLLNVAIKEVKEESGVTHVTPLHKDIYSLEILTVDGHEKKGKYVPSHLHANITYLLEVDEKEKLIIKEDENSDVAWFTLDQALQASSEPWFVKRIYKKLNQKLENI